jgi:DNA-binding CsgD family transcriptional regulator
VAAAGRQLTWGDWAAWLARRSGGRSADAGAVGWPSLTDTEVEVARRAAEGLSNAELADAMFVSVNTVKTHIRHVYEKLDVHSRVELAQVVDRHT